MFSTVLIADRGEIVMRIARTCERLGIRTLAIQTDAEATPSYASACDESLQITGSSSGAFDSASLIAIAQQHGAQAIHPGAASHGRDPRFAAAVREAGLSFVGAAPEVLERLTDPLAYVELARQAGVRALPSCTVDADNPHDAIEQASAVGYPLWVCGRHSSVEAVCVESEDELFAALVHVRDATGGAALRLQHRLVRSRLLSVHVVADGHDAIALADAEHSVIDGGLRLLEEAPAPALLGALGEQRRLALREAATRVTAEAGVIGTAVVAFELDTANRFYLTGIDAGLSLEHAPIEMCTRLDLVELQLRIASGERLPETALRVQQTGHAIQARLYAEPEPEHAPSDTVPASELAALRWPMLAPGRLRVETDLALGAQPARDRDRHLGRVIGYGPTRHQAVLALDRALAEATLEPLRTNLPRIRELLADESFRAGQFDQEFTLRTPSQATTHTSA